MQNLYDILGVARSASNKDINAALRQLVRRYNEETAHGTRDSTEALKFINRARLTFADAERRAQYDAELAAFGVEQARLAVESEVAALQISERQVGEQQPSAQPLAASLDNVIRFDDLVTASRIAMPGKASQTAGVAALRSASASVPALDLRLDRLSLGKAALEPETLDSVLMPIPMGDDFERMQFTAAPPMPAGPAGLDLRSILASQDSTDKRSTAPRPAARFTARFIDYALWGVLLALLLHYLAGAGTLAAGTAQMLTSPFIAPIIITASWALVEAVLLIFFPVTPGKFLLNIRVAMNVSNPYAAADPGAHFAASFARAFRAWWRGMAGGITPIFVLTLFKARKKLLSFKETTWDFDSDCLTTHGKVNAAGGLLAILLLFGGAWLYGSHWAPPFWQTLTVGWRSSEAGFAAGRQMWKVLGGDLPTYGKEIPAPPAKENRTVAMEQEAQALTDKQQWQDLSEHCLAWRREDERNANAWFCYGRARHQLADYTGAISALKRAALLAPQDDDIRRLLRDASLNDMQQRQLRKRQASQQAEPAQ